MVAIAPPTTLPRLGDAETAFADRFGQPLWLQPTRDGSISAFEYQGVILTVLFHDGHAVAVRCPFALHQRRVFSKAVAPGDVGTADSEVPRVFISDTGWIVATAACPWSALRALAIS